MPPDRLILAFDTSAAHCAAALLRGDRVLARRVEVMATGQADRLVPLLEELLAESKVTWADLHGIGVGTGPGNFTGIRIAVSAARGLALALGIPAIGVTVLEALAFGSAGEVLVTLDGRLGDYYGQRFRDGLAEDEARLCSRDDFAMGPVKCIGFDNAAIAAHIGGTAGSPLTTPDPVALARIAQSRLGSVQPKPAPFYLRAPDAAPSHQPVPKILP